MPLATTTNSYPLRLEAAATLRNSVIILTLGNLYFIISSSLRTLLSLPRQALGSRIWLRLEVPTKVAEAVATLPSPISTTEATLTSVPSLSVTHPIPISNSHHSSHNNSSSLM